MFKPIKFLKTNNQWKIQAYLVFCLLSISNGYKILFMVPFPGSSHWMVLQNFAKELMNRGHEVTAIVNQPIKNFKSSNYTEILIDPPYDLAKILSQDEAFSGTDESDFEKVRSYHKFVKGSSEHGLATMNVQKIIHSENLHFDLIINADFFHESWLMFAHKFNAPIVTICPYGYSDFFDRAMGLLTPWSHVPHMLLPYGDDMTYLQRVYNVILSAYDWWYRNWVMLEHQNRIASQYFAHLAEPGKPLPHIDDLYRNISLILVNVHKSISPPRPQMPGIVHYGGAHIKPPRPLPPHLQEYLDNSKHGVIIFSLGSHLKSSQLPKEKIDAFLNAFSQFKQRVIWKFEDESYQVPSNVLVQKWLPQSDILAHPNVVLFITHGGMSGTFEGVERGVPMLFIPFFADQQRNALRAERIGNGRSVSFSQLTAESFSAALNEMLTNKAYDKRAKEIARLFNDNLVHPMDEAIYWIEYVIRSKGAKHLKSYATNMPWHSYLLLDVFVLPFAVIAFILIFVKLLLRYTKGDHSDRKLKKNKSKRA